MELISNEGDFNEKNLKEFEEFFNGGSYAVVSTMGPQGIGKSSLLNRLFDTNFKEWNEFMESGEQTTKGVCIANLVREKLPLVIMDIEGTDGHERGEDVTFEKQSALYALLFAHILLINIHKMDIGKEQGANRRLLTTIFQAALAMPSFNPRKTTLFFVIRDTTPFDERTRKSVIDRQKKNVNEIWEAVQKPQGHQNAPLYDFFTVEFFSLPLYHDNDEQFEEEVAKLGREISNLISAELLDSGFFENAKNIWETIKKNEDLNIPSLKVMVATLQCDRTVRKILKEFETDDQDWLAIREAVETKFVPDLGATITSILSKYLSQYDSTLIHCESEEIRNEKRQDLEASILSLLHPAYMKNIRRLRSDHLESFRTQLDAALNSGEGGSTQSDDLKECCVNEFDLGAATPEQATWEHALTERQQLLCDIQLHITNKVSQILHNSQSEVSYNLLRELSRLFFEVEITWASVNQLLGRKINDAINNLSTTAAVLESELENVRNDLKQHARREVQQMFEDETINIQGLMERRYIRIYGEEMSRYELPTTDNSNIEARAAEEAYRECLKLLSTMAVIRLDEAYDVVEGMLFSELMPDTNNGVRISERVLDSNTWEGVPPEVTLITPSECRNTWEQFKQEMETNASAQRIEQLTDVFEREYGSTPPRWLIMGLLTIGVAGVLLLLRFSNLDLTLLAWLARTRITALAPIASRGIALAPIARRGIALAPIAACGVAISGEAIHLLRNLLELLRNNNMEAINRFRREHQTIMTSLRNALEEMFETIAPNLPAGANSISLMPA